MILHKLIIIYIILTAYHTIDHDARSIDFPGLANCAFQHELPPPLAHVAFGNNDGDERIATTEYHSSYSLRPTRSIAMAWTVAPSPWSNASTCHAQAGARAVSR